MLEKFGVRGVFESCKGENRFATLGELALQMIPQRSARRMLKDDCHEAHGYDPICLVKLESPPVGGQNWDDLAV